MKNFVTFALLFFLQEGIEGKESHRSLQREIDCLARILYFEARGTSERDQMMVANVIVNRKKSDLFPNSICEMILQKKQFPWVKKRFDIREKRIFNKMKDLSRKILLEGKGRVIKNRNIVFFSSINRKNCYRNCFLFKALEKTDHRRR